MWSRRLTSAPPPYSASLIRHPRAFLLRIAMNVVRDESRRRKKRGTSETFTEAADPGEAAGQMEALMLKQAVSTMPALYREVFVLSRFAGMSYPEIAAARRLRAAPRPRPAEPCPDPRHLQHHPARRSLAQSSTGSSAAENPATNPSPTPLHPVCPSRSNQGRDQGSKGQDGPAGRESPDLHKPRTLKAVNPCRRRRSGRPACPAAQPRILTRARAKPLAPSPSLLSTASIGGSSDCFPHLNAKSLCRHSPG
ncbi:MAG TPA: hypothetical protein DCP26_08495 [Brevundimonas sp.]|nr:hypothetical protein [Brevundimonas sp.]